MQKLKAMWRNSITAKAIAVGVLTLIMLIPVGMIEGVIYDRMQNRAEAEEDITQSWGRAQTIGGPVLVLPYRIINALDYGMTSLDQGYAVVLPERLEIDGELEPEFRYRGVHEIPVYRASLAIEGSFRITDFDHLGISLDDVRWDEAFVALATTDPRAIQETPDIQLGDRRIRFAPIKQQVEGMPPQIGALLGEAPPRVDGESALEFELTLKINGSRHFAVLPYGDTTRVQLTSSWNSPSFFGSYLPASRTIDAEGFQAEWLVSSIGRPLPPSWHQYDIDTSLVADNAFGVRLYTAVSMYRLMMRAITYAVLFIALTFVSWFLFEVLAGLRLHPLQYLLIGLANALFFLLLLSLAEHIGFGLAYFASATASCGLVAAYSHAVLRQGRRALTMLGILGGLYAFLYMTLRAEDYAMLFGSIALWLSLAAIMYLTRKLDWYRVGLSAALESQPAREER